MKRFFSTRPMRVFTAYAGVVAGGMLFLLISGTEACPGRLDRDPAFAPPVASSGGYSGGRHVWSTGGSGWGFGK